MVVRDPLAVDTVLTPVDGSKESVAASECAIAVADRYDASVHELYVLGRGVVSGMDVGTVDEEDVAETTQEFFDDAAALAEETGVEFTRSVTHGFSQSRKTRHPGSAVLDTAETIDADFIVLPRESVVEPEMDVLAKTSEYVLSYASQPVLSVP